MQFEPIAKDVYLLKIPFCGIWVGVYLIRGERNVLIDSGLNGEGVDRFLLPALAGLGLRAEDIDCLYNTHTHGDHIGGHARLKERNERLTVLCPVAGEDKIRHPLQYNIAIRRRFPKDSAEPSWHLKGVACDGVLSDGEERDGLRVIATPGHDDDCCCYLHLATGTLLTGDSLQQNGTDTQGMALYMDLDAYRDSIAKLKKTEIRRIVCGHPFNPLGAFAEGERACAEYLDYCLNLTYEYDNLIAELHGQGKNMRECAVGVIGAVNGIVPDRLYLAMYTVSEHLKKIIGKGM